MLLKSVHLSLFLKQSCQLKKEKIILALFIPCMFFPIKNRQKCFNFRSDLQVIPALIPDAVKSFPKDHKHSSTYIFNWKVFQNISLHKMISKTQQVAKDLTFLLEVINNHYTMFMK